MCLQVAWRGGSSKPEVALRAWPLDVSALCPASRARLGYQVAVLTMALAAEIDDSPVEMDERAPAKLS